MSESLSEKQRRFTYMVGQWIVGVYEMGYELTFGEAYRPPELAELYEAQGRGIRNSLHIQRLAVDFNLFVDGEYKMDTESYRAVGEYWESLGGTWGGRFGDGNHISLEHRGYK